MKRVLGFIGILALVLGLVTGCPDDTDNGGGKGKGPDPKITSVWLASSGLSDGETEFQAGWSWPYAAIREFEKQTDETYKITMTSIKIPADINFLYFRIHVRLNNNTGYYLYPKGARRVDINNEMEMQRTQGATDSWEADCLDEEFTIVFNPKTDTFILSVDDFDVEEVIVSPATADVEKGTERQFTAQVNGHRAPQTVIWSIVGAEENGKTAAGSEITNTGLVKISETEPDGSLTIHATSTATGFTDIFGAAVITVIPPATEPTVYDVEVSPSENVSVMKGRTQQFNAQVFVGGGAVDTVVWSIKESVVTGTGINTAGLLTVALAETAATITVVATPTQAGFTDKAAEVSVSLNIPEVWMVGASTVWNWTGTSNKMNPVMDGSVFTGKFKWEGELAPNGEAFAFNHSWNGTPAWSGANSWFTAKSDADADKTIQNKTGEQEFDIVPGDSQAPMFRTLVPGDYTVTLDIVGMKAIIELAEIYDPVEELNKEDDFTVYIVGTSAIPDWLNNLPSKEMTRDVDTGIFTWTGNLNAGFTNPWEGISFVTTYRGAIDSDDWDAANLNVWISPEDTDPEVENIATAQEFPVEIKDGGGHGYRFFKILTDGNYTITLNPYPDTMTVIFLRNGDKEIEINDDYDVWLIGSSVTPMFTMPPPAGLKMEKTGDTFTWSGNLNLTHTHNDQGVSFITNKNGTPDWNGSYWLVSTQTALTDRQVGENGTTPQVFTLNEGGNMGHRPFDVIEIGHYTITLNRDAMTVTFERNGDQID
jgi:hypothetical protein